MSKCGCVVVADSSRARFFLVAGRKREWQEGTALEHLESRMTGQQLHSDRSGRSFDSVGGGRHAMADKSEIREQEAQVFAREVCQELRRQAPLDSCDRLALVAPPQFLGQLRKALPEEFLRRLAWDLDKNLVTRELAEIRRHAPPGW